MLKKLLASLLAILLAAVPALGAAQSDGLAVEITGMELLDEWNGEASQTHAFLAVYATLTNWSAETLSLSENLRAELVYADRYVFAAEPSFPVTEMEQLVRVEGAMVFRIPVMVAETAPADIAMTVYAGDQTIPQEVVLETAYQPARSGSLEGAGFDSPEEAATAYLEAMQNGDAMGMLSTFAIETYVDNMDVQASLERMKAFNHSMLLLLADGAYLHDVLVGARYGEISNDLYMQYLFYECGWEGSTIPLTEEGAVEAFLSNENLGAFPALLQGLEFVEFVDPTALSERYASQGIQESLEKLENGYGCDELTDVAMRLTDGGAEYYQFLQCARYGERWYVFSLTGSLASLMMLSPYAGGFVPAAELGSY